MSKRSLTHSQKKFVAASQHFKCNNKPGSKLKGIRDYKCPLWKDEDNKGTFDISGYEIDHIKEWSISNDDSLDNLQALCISCHKVKTKNFMMRRKKKEEVQDHEDEDLPEEGEIVEVHGFRCKFCEKTFSSKGSLTRHQSTTKSCSGYGSKKTYQCTYCGKHFTHQFSLNRHIQICASKREAENEQSFDKQKEEYLNRIALLEKDLKDQNEKYLDKIASLEKVNKDKLASYKGEKQEVKKDYQRKR